MTTNHLKNTAFEAYKDKNIIILKDCLSHGLNVDELYSHEQTLLYLCLQEKHIHYEMIEFLVHNQANVNHIDSLKKVPMITNICMRSNSNAIKIMQLFIENGLNLSIQIDIDDCVMSLKDFIIKYTVHKEILQMVTFE